MRKRGVPMPKTLPSAVKEARGCYIKNPGRRPQGEPQTGKGLGSPPACLSVEEKKVWKKIAAEIASGVLQSSDRTLFMLFTRLATKLYLNDPLNGVEMSVLAQLGSKMGLSPVDRQKVVVNQPKESALAKFLSGKGEKVTSIS